MHKDIFTKINNEPCFIRKPDQPNEYGVIILGGSSCFVGEDTSDFHENPIRNEFINQLVSKGYTVGYSNTHNKNWGSPSAARDIESLHRTMVEECYLNPSVHLIASSMGAVLGLKLLSRENISIRSLLLLKPVMDLYSHRNYVLNREKDDRIVTEISEAYGLKKENVVEYLLKNPLVFTKDKSKEVGIKVVYGKRDDTSPFENNLKVLNYLISSGFPVEMASLNSANHNSDNLFFDVSAHINFLIKSE